MSKKRTSKVGRARVSATVKHAVATTSSKRKAKKWSKDKTRQKQKELDDQVCVVYDAIRPQDEVQMLPNSPHDDIVAVNALEESLRGL